MEMHIGEMNSTVRVTDVERIVQAVLAQVRAEQERDGRRRDETRISNSRPGGSEERWG